MNKYTFPLMKRVTSGPVAIVTDSPVTPWDSTPIIGKMIFKDGKSCDVTIHYSYDVDNDTVSLNDLYVVDGMGNCVIADANHWYQVAYKQVSRKD